VALLSAHAALADDECGTTLSLDSVLTPFGFAIQQNHVQLGGCFGEAPKAEDFVVLVMDFPCTVVSVNTTNLNCSLPAHADEDGYGDVQVRVNGVILELQNAYTYYNPRITVVDPSQINENATIELFVEYAGPSLPDTPYVTIGDQEVAVTDFPAERNYFQVLATGLREGTYPMKIYFRQLPDDDSEEVTLILMHTKENAVKVVAPVDPDLPYISNVEPYFMLATDEFNKNRTIHLQGTNLGAAKSAKFAEVYACDDFKISQDDTTGLWDIWCDLATCDLEGNACAISDHIRLFDQDNNLVAEAEFAFALQPSINGTVQPHAAAPGNFADEVEFTIPLINPVPTGAYYYLSAGEDDTNEIPLQDTTVDDNGVLHFSPLACVAGEDQICEFNKGYALVMRNVLGQLLYRSANTVFTYHPAQTGPTIATKRDFFVGYSGWFTIEGAWFSHFKITNARWERSDGVTTDPLIADVTDASIRIEAPPCAYPDLCKPGAKYDLRLIGADDDQPRIFVATEVLTAKVGALFEGTVVITFENTEINGELLTKIENYIASVYNIPYARMKVEEKDGLVSVLIVDYLETHDANTEFTPQKFKADILNPDSQFTTVVAKVSKAEVGPILSYCSNGEWAQHCSDDPVPDNGGKKKGFDGAIFAYIIVPIVVLALLVYAYRKWKARKDNLSIQGLLDDHAAYNEIHEF